MKKRFGKHRIKRGFLFWPKTLWNTKLLDYETRWLEMAEWKEKRYINIFHKPFWEAKEWILEK